MVSLPSVFWKLLQHCSLFCHIGGMEAKFTNPAAVWGLLGPFSRINTQSLGPDAGLIFNTGLVYSMSVIDFSLN